MKFITVNPQLYPKYNYNTNYYPYYSYYLNNQTRLLTQRPHKHPRHPIIPIFFIFGFSSDLIFILSYAMPYTNLQTKFQKTPSMFVE
jgi:hypothetical protein